MLGAKKIFRAIICKKLFQHIYIFNIDNPLGKRQLNYVIILVLNLLVLISILLAYLITYD